MTTDFTITCWPEQFPLALLKGGEKGKRSTVVLNLGFERASYGETI
jgi:hypothetical protein